MAQPSYGSSGSLRIYLNGKLQSLTDIISFTGPNPTNTMNQSYYIGNAVPVGSMSPGHYEGTIELEVSDDASSQLNDAIITATRTGVGFPSIVMDLTEVYPTGESVTRSYTDCQLLMDQSNAGSNQLKTRTFRYQAMFSRVI